MDNATLTNAPKERLAQILASRAVADLNELGPRMTNEEIRQAGKEALHWARKWVLGR